MCLAIGLVDCTCDKSEPTAEAKSELNDVRKACEYQQAWAHRIRQECTHCLGLAAAPACNCPTDRKEYSGKCAVQQQAKIDETACEPVYRCTYECKRSDCDCIARCYEGQERCHKLVSEVEGCLAEVCDPYCK